MPGTSDQPHDCRIGSTYTGSSGYAKIPGSKCTGNLYPPLTKECQEVPLPPPPPVVHSTPFTGIPAVTFMQDAILVLSDTTLHSSMDRVSWRVVLENVIALIAHPHDPKQAYAHTTTGVQWTGDSFRTTTHLSIPQSSLVFGKQGVLYIDSRSLFYSSNGRDFGAVHDSADSCLFNNDSILCVDGTLVIEFTPGVISGWNARIVQSGLVSIHALNNLIIGFSVCLL
jgi:hypothetical protein